VVVEEEEEESPAEAGAPEPEQEAAEPEPARPPLRRRRGEGGGCHRSGEVRSILHFIFIFPSSGFFWFEGDRFDQNVSKLFFFLRDFVRLCEGVLITTKANPNTYSEMSGHWLFISTQDIRLFSKS